MKLKNTLVAFSTFAVCLAYQSSSAQITPIADKHETGGQMYPAHFVPWPPIKESEIAKKTRLWEDIVLTDEGNSFFASANSRKPLLKTLVAGVLQGKIKAYASLDGRFTHALTKEEFLKEFKSKHIPGSEIKKYAIKEDSLYLKTGEKTVRIIGLAPIVATTMPDGTVKEEPMFWVYYPDSRSFLCTHRVSSEVTWDDVFERQQFKGAITKTSPPQSSKSK